MTIKELLSKDDKITLNDKKILLSSLLNISLSDLILSYSKELQEEAIIKYNKYLQELKTKPLQYVLNKTYFFRDEYYIDENVLIPRPETERLVLDTINLINEHLQNNISILDIGTGSGCIAISLKKAIPNSSVTAVDISNKALEVAKQNAKTNNTSITFIESNLFSKVEEKFDVIISNPPYIKNDEEIESIVKDNEPHQALYGGEDGLTYYKLILKDIKKYLKPKSIIAFEIGSSMEHDLLAIVKEYFPLSRIISSNDYNNLNRYLYIINE